MTASMPPWGCPWHGLVKNSLVHLPNGTPRPYPQPPGTGWRAGSAALIARPGMPEVETPPEQVAAGMEWRNTATLAGRASLHGCSLGAGAWIYIDPDGERWRVTTTLSTANLLAPPSAVTVTLDRFGVFGGQPQTYEYSVPVPNLGQSTPSIGSVKAIRAVVFDVRAQGDGAIFMVYVNWLTAASGARPDDYFGDIPVGWLELTLAGPGAECAVQVQTLKTRAQTLGAVTGIGAELAVGAVVFFVDDKNDITFQGSNSYVITRTIVRRDVEPPGDAGALRFAVADAATISRSVTGYVLALWYREGSISELVLSATEEYTRSADAPVFTEGGGQSTYVDGEKVSDEWYGDAVVTYSSTGSVETRVTLAVDGVVGTEFEYRYAEAIAIEIRHAKGSTTITRERERDYNGSTESGSTVEVYDWQQHSNHSVPTPSQLRLPEGASWLSWLGQIAWLYGSNRRVVAYRGSNKVFGLSIFDGASQDIKTPLVTAGGAISPAIPPHGMGGYGFPPLFASLCPVTGQLALDSDHVCWV